MQTVKSEFDGWRSISAAMYMALVGYGVLVGVPVISTAWVGFLGFTEEQVGRVVGMDLAGLTVGAVITALFVRSLNRRLLVLLGIGLAVTANGLCLISTDYDMVLWLRLMSGLGSGIYTAIAVATLGGSSKPTKTYTLMMLGFAFSQTIEMHTLPRLPMNGIYLVFILCFMLTLPWLRWIPPHPVQAKPAGDESGMKTRKLWQPANYRPFASFLPWFCLTAIFFTYVNIGAYWTYIELAALGSGIAKSWIVPLLTWVSLGSVLGCLAAMMISDRYGFSRPLLLSLLGMALIAGLLAGEINHLTLFISLLFFNLLWVFIDVYQMSTLAVIDRSGTFASLLPASQGLGQLAGPNIAASMLGAGMGYSKVFLMCSLAVTIGMLFYLVLYVFMRRTVPELSGKAH
jgi:predicted MFS family arabinose efflux permease